MRVIHWLKISLLSLMLALPALFFSSMAQATPPSFADMVEPRLAAVVNISTTQKLQSRGVVPFDLDSLPDDPAIGPFKDLFKQFEEHFGDRLKGKPRKATSLGSGFVISEDGYIVTNNHVVSGAEQITITFHDDTTLPAKIIGRDPKTDLALLKVESKKRLNYVRFGSSDDLRVGEWVVAVGNPFGLGGSVSAGIVSARGRNINVGPFDDFIQTDAAVNRGNSGGPLFNVKGEVVGINSAIFSPTGGNVGISFAVPSALAEPLIKQLREKGHAERAWIGVQIQEVTEDIAASIGLDNAHGALVIDVDEEGPAKHSGIQPGDVIVQFEGKPIHKMRELPRLVAESAIGKKAVVRVWRNGGVRNYTVKLGELPSDEPRLRKSDNAPTNGHGHSDTVLGAVLDPLNRALRERYQIDAQTTGLLIRELDADSPLARVGARARDIILQINQRGVERVADLKKEIQAAREKGRKSVLLRVQRNGSAQFVTVPIDGSSE